MPDWIAIAEASYRLEGSLDDWVAGLRDACAPTLDQGLGVAVHTARTTATTLRTESVKVHGGPPGFAEIVRSANEGASPGAVRRFLGWGTSVSTMSEAVFDALPEARERFDEQTGGSAPDVLGVVALCGPGRLVSVSIPIRGPRRPTVGERRDLGRIGTHLAAGLRLREALSNEPDDGDRAVDAVLAPDGRMCEASGAARAAGPRDRLRAAVRAVERARTRGRRGDPESLALWQGLVDGRWSLIDRFEGDGRRFVVARRNAPWLGDPRGLSAREHQVAEHVGAGRTHKEIAYELGVSESAVANAAARAQRKLALDSRTELARFFAPGGLRARLVSFELGGEAFAAGVDDIALRRELRELTDAERDVTLQLLRGATNAEVARLRGTSPHTVAKQVRSIFERLGVRSRVELASLLARE